MQEDPGQTGADEGSQGITERIRAVIENAPAVGFLLDREGGGGREHGWGR